MKKRFLKTLVIVFLSCVLFVHAQTYTQTFNYSGATQTFVMPYCTGPLTVHIRGANGGNCANGGGYGGGMLAVMSSTPGTVLYLNVGSLPTGSIGGFNGGGNGGPAINPNHKGCGGGGASDIRIGGTSLNNRVLVAGGGGGSGGGPGNNGYGGDGGSWSNTCNSPFGSSGTAGWGYMIGGVQACAGGSASGYGMGGNAGGLTSPGGGSTASGGSWGSAGGFGIGGNGGGNFTLYGGETNGIYGAGGGGGGYYGGGGGFSGNYSTLTINAQEGGGGGGSTYADVNLFNPVTFLGQWGGDGIIQIMYSFTSAAIAVTGQSTMCPGGTVTLNAGGTDTYSWSAMPGFAASNNSIISVSPSATTVYTVTGTNSIGCVSSTFATVNVLSNNPVITPLYTPTSAAVCAGGSIRLQGSGANTYTWTGGISNNVFFVPASTQNYTVTGSNGCGTGTAVATVSVYPNPTLTLVPTQTSICTGNSVAINASGASQYFFTNYYTLAPFVLFSSSVVPVIGISAQGCTATANTTIQVYNPPTAFPNQSASQVCAGGSVTLSATGAMSYTWLPMNTTLAAVSVTPVGNSTYTVIEANGNCSITNTLSVQVVQIPTVSIAITNTQACAGSTMQMNASGANFYNWSGPSGGIGSGNPVLFTLFNSGIYTVTGSSGICSATSTVNLFAIPAPTISIQSVPAVCIGESLTLTASGASTYTWSTGSTGSLLSLSPVSNSVITVTGTNSNNCSSLQQKLITVNPLPLVTISSNASQLCNGKSATLTASGAQTYTWNTLQLTNTIAVTPSISTIFSVTGTSSAGCTNGNTYSITVYSSTFSVVHTGSCCAGQTYPVQLSGAVSYSVNGFVSLAVFNFTPVATNVFTVTGANVFNNYTCTSVKTETINVFANPNVNLNIINDKLCFGETGTVVAGGALSYSWSTGQTSPQVTFTAQSLQTSFTVTGTDANGCINTATTVVLASKCTDIEKLVQNSNLKVFPNPARDRIYIESAEKLEVSLYDVTGRLCSTVSVEPGSVRRISLERLPAGVYFLRDIQRSVNIKIVVE